MGRSTGLILLMLALAWGGCRQGGSDGDGDADGDGDGDGDADGDGDGDGDADGDGDGDGDGDADPCGTDRQLCGGECVDTTLDPRHCGECDHRCTDGEVCDGSSCVEAPDCRSTPCTGLSYCDLATGQCRPGCANDEQCGANEHCELASHACTCDSGTDRCEGLCVSTSDPGDQPCAGGEFCDFDSGECRPGCAFDSQCGENEHCADELCVCDTGTHDCSGDCVLNTSVDSCGSRCEPCEVPANATATCNGTSCGYTCNSGFHDCSGACLSNTSTESCGSLCEPCPEPTHSTATCDGSSCGFTCDGGYVPDADTCVENCSTAGCEGFTWCDDTTGLCEEGCTHHDQCDYGDFCVISTHTCELVWDPGCGTGFRYMWMCSDHTDFCVNNNIPSGTEYPFVEPCPEGTTERSTWYCSDVTRICVPDL